MTIDQKISTLISSQLPDFLRENNETFVAFLRAYYEYLEQDEKAQYVLQTARSYADVDKTLDSFVDYFLKQYAYGIPLSIFTAGDTEAKRFLTKYIGSLYRSKGSVNALKFLFRLAFDEEINVIFPYDFVLKTSDGKFGRVSEIRANIDSSTNVDALIGKVVTSSGTGITTFIDSYIKQPDGYYSIYLNEKDFFPNEIQFSAGEKLLVEDPNVAANITVTNTLVGVDIIDGGLGYKLTDTLTVNPAGPRVSISKVNESGKIIDITVVDPSSNIDSSTTITIGASTDTRLGSYIRAGNVVTAVLNSNLKHGLSLGDNVNIIVSTGTLASNNYIVSDILTKKTFRFNSIGANTSGNLTLTYKKNIANLKANIGTVIRSGTGYGLSEDGQLDTIILLQDSYKWQQYSYIIRSNLNVDKWLNLVKKTLHPAGLALFGEVTIYTDVAGSTGAAYAGPVNKTAYDAYISIILDIINSSSANIQMKQAQNSYYVIESYVDSSYIDSGVSRYSAGATLESIDQFKFEYGIVGANTFPINNILDYVIGDFSDYRNRKTAFQPPSFRETPYRDNANANLILWMTTNDDRSYL